MVFRKGQASPNPAGRPRGSRHKFMVALDSIGKDNAAEILATVVAAAKAGDMIACKMILDRVMPPRKGSPVRLSGLPPLEDPADGRAIRKP